MAPPTEPRTTSHNLPKPTKEIAASYVKTRAALREAEAAERQAARKRREANRLVTHYKAELEAAHGTLFDE